MPSAYGNTPVEAHFDRDLVVTWAGPQAEDVLSECSDPVQRAGIHEAGHAVAAWRFGRGISGAFVTAAGTGVAMFGPMGSSTAALEEARHHGRKEETASEAPSSRPLSDARRACLVARMLRADRRARRELLRVRRFEARLFVNQYRHLILAVATELLKAGRLTGLEIEAIIDRTLAAARLQRLRELGL